MINRPEDELRRMLEQTLIPSPNVVELYPDAVAVTTSRLGHARGDIAEQYQLETRLSAHRAANVVSPPATAAFLRQWFFETGADGVAELERLNSSQVRALETLPEPLPLCLAPFVPFTSELAPLYAADVIVGVPGGLWRLVGGTGRLTFEGTFDAQERAAVVDALESWPPDADPGEATFVFLVGAFVRAALLAHVRGHRNAVLNAGVLAGRIRASWLAAQRANELLVTSELFLDGELDRVLRNDGVERAALAVLAFCPLRPGSRPA